MSTRSRHTRTRSATTNPTQDTSERTKPSPGSPDARRTLGATGEDLASAWYLQRGYTLLDRNWRTKYGELDLVLEKSRTVVFSEVKTRRSNRFGHPAESVTHSKQARIRTLATQWLQLHPHRRGRLRFDVVAVTPEGIEVIQAAF